MKKILKFNDFNISEADSKDSGHFCKWCGDEFTPTKKLQLCCCVDCNSKYNEYMSDIETTPFSWAELPVKKVIESQQIKDPNSLIVGKKYKITWPCYDDFDEGLEPEVDVMEVVEKNKADGYILKHSEHGWTISRHPQMLKDCEIEMLEESPQNEEISFKKMATAAALAGAVAFGNPVHSQDVKKDSIEQVSKVKGEITSIKELKKMGYKIDDSIDDSQKNLKLELTNIKSIGSTNFAAQRQFRANLDVNGLLNFQLNRGNSGFGFSVTRELDNGNIEFRLVKILK
jgi:hypothetical protein